MKIIKFRLTHDLSEKALIDMSINKRHPTVHISTNSANIGYKSSAKVSTLVFQHSRNLWFRYETLPSKLEIGSYP
jgi:hypothetical protein